MSKPNLTRTAVEQQLADYQVPEPGMKFWVDRPGGWSGPWVITRLSHRGSVYFRGVHERGDGDRRFTRDEWEQRQRSGRVRVMPKEQP